MLKPLSKNPKRTDEAESQFNIQGSWAGLTIDPTECNSQLGLVFIEMMSNRLQNMARVREEIKPNYEVKNS